MKQGYVRRIDIKHVIHGQEWLRGAGPEYLFNRINKRHNCTQHPSAPSTMNFWPRLRQVSRV
jgi:hypothetical protein